MTRTKTAGSKGGAKGRGWNVSAHPRSPSQQHGILQPGRMLQRPGEARMSSCRSPTHWFSAPAHPFPRTMTCGAHPAPAMSARARQQAWRCAGPDVSSPVNRPSLQEKPCTDVARQWGCFRHRSLPADLHCRATPVDLPGASTVANCAAGAGPARLAAPSGSCGTATTTTHHHNTQRPPQRRPSVHRHLPS